MEHKVDANLMRLPPGSPSKVTSAVKAAVKDFAAEAEGALGRVAAAADRLEHQHEPHTGEIALGERGIEGGPSDSDAEGAFGGGGATSGEESATGGADRLKRLEEQRAAA